MAYGTDITKKQDFQILYEDKHIIVCEKPPGLPTQSSRIGIPDMISCLKNHIFQTAGTQKTPDNRHTFSKEPYLAVIHRLDQPVRGILVFAKTPAAAKELNRQLQSKEFGKYYRALVTGTPPQKDGTLENYMVKDGKTNTSRICTKDTKDAKLARLHYHIVDDGSNLFSAVPGDFGCSELEIHLDTGRHHQIRCQLSHIGCPIVGDTKYNPSSSSDKKWQQIHLCACRLEFKHPATHKPLCFKLDTLQ